jgi:hypothetical protein
MYARVAPVRDKGHPISDNKAQRARRNARQILRFRLIALQFLKPRMVSSTAIGPVTKAISNTNASWRTPCP